MGVSNSEIFLGSGAHLAFVPELDFFFRASGDGSTVTSLQIEGSLLVQFQLVKDMYVGCTIDFYDAGTYTSSHLVTANDHDTFTITPSIASITAADDEFVLRAYGAPCPAPDSDDDGTGKTRLNADNWLGLVESATFPNTEIEMKQMNLHMGGTRNYSYQYKGMETASGGSLGFICHQATWLYYALGLCEELTAAGADNTAHPTNYHTGTAAHGLYIHGTSATSHIDKGPFIHRVNPVGDGSTPSVHIVPPINELIESAPQTHFDKVPYPIAATGQYITYKFKESDTAHLPSFALEQSLSKLATNPWQSEEASDAEDLNFVRVARGNRVNTLTMTANENEELKMTLDLNTRAVTEIPQDLASPSTGYEARGGQTTDTSLFNYTSEATHLEPFFFSDGTISVYGQQFLKITNFTLTINNNLQDKRFVGVSKRVKDAIPAQRTYEISFTALVTDDTLFTELLNTDENNDAGQSIDLVFTKDSGESLTMAFDDYYTTANTWTIPDDKGPVTVEATLMPRTLTNCTTISHWVLQG